MSVQPRESRRVTAIQIAGVVAITFLVAVTLSSILQGGGGTTPIRPSASTLPSGNPSVAAARSSLAKLPTLQAQMVSASPSGGPQTAGAQTGRPSITASASSPTGVSAGVVTSPTSGAAAGTRMPALPTSVTSAQSSSPVNTASPMQVVNGPAQIQPPASSVPSVAPASPAPSVASSTSQSGSTSSVATPSPSAASQAPASATPRDVTTGSATGLSAGITSDEAATAIETGQPVPGASTVGSTAANPLEGTNSQTYNPPTGNAMSAAYYGLNVYPSTQPPPTNWTPLVSNAYQTLPLSAAPYGYGPGNPFYGNGSAPYIDANPNDGTRDPITGQVWYPSTPAGAPTQPGWVPTTGFSGQ